MCRYLPFLVLICFSLLLKVEAQVHQQLATTHHFQHYSVEHGLISTEILCMAEDYQGYIWVGGVGGLYRFDGHEFIPIDLNAQLNTPQADAVSYIYEDSQKGLWISTLGSGLRKLDRKTGKFTHYIADEQDSLALSTNGVVRMLEDREGQFWVGTHRGLFLMNRKDGTFRYFPHDSERPNRTIHVMSLDMTADGSLWIGTISQGLFHFDPRQKVFSHFDLPYDDGETIGDYQVRIRKTFEDSRGDLWVGSTAGLFQINGQSNKIVTYRYQEEDSSSIVGSSIMDILEDSLGNLWIATQSGLSKFDRSKISFTNYVRDDADANSLSNNYVDNIILSRDGIIWLGTGGGVSSLIPEVGRFIFYGHNRRFSNEDLMKPISVMAHDGAEEQIWIGGPDGYLAVFNPFNHSLRAIDLPFPETDLTFTKDITALTMGHDGSVWIGTRAIGLFQYFPDTELFRSITNTIPSSFKASEVKITALTKSQDHSIWIATLNRGLIRYNPDENSFTQFLPDKNDSSSIGSSQPYHITEDRSGYLWVALNEEGVDRLDPETETFFHYGHHEEDEKSLSSDLVNVIFEDKTGQIWIGTDRGLNQLLPDQSGFTHFGPGEGFINSYVSSIEEDANNQLWIGTDQGVFQYSPNTNTFHKFDREDGLPNQAFLWDCSLYDTTTNQMVFGTAGGLLIFTPESFNENVRIPETVISKGLFYKRNQNAFPREDLWLQNEELIELDYDENIMEFQLSSLNFYQASKNQYAYSLESSPGFSLTRDEPQWFHLATEHKLRFTNLPSGTHVLRVKGSNNDGYWSEEVDLTIKISPPWWYSWWAILGYALIIIFIFYFLRNMDLQRRLLLQRAEVEHARAQEKQLQNEQIERQAKQLQESLEELKSKNRTIVNAQNQLIQQEKLASLGQLMGGIAHEIKNPLNFVNNFAEGSSELLDELTDEIEKYRSGIVKEDFHFIKNTILELKDNASDILNHGNRLNRIVNSMMDQARGGNDELRPIVLHEFLDDHIELAYHGYRAKQADFNVRIEREFDENIRTLNVFGQDFGRVLINLLNNAFYTVSQKEKQLGSGFQPQVTVVTLKANDNIQIMIRDNGEGILEEKLNKIFEPFYTSKPTGSGNTGLGLYISYDIIVNRHGGEMKVKSESGEYTELVITLPDS